MSEGEVDPGSESRSSHRADADRLAEVHTLVGRYISTLNSIDSYIDSAICVYFDQLPPNDEEFRSWVLARFGATEKADLVGQITRACNVESYFKPFLREVRSAHTYRNDLVHSYIALDPTDVLQEGSVSGAEVRREVTAIIRSRHHKSGPRVSSIDGEEIETQLANVLALHFMGVRLVTAMFSWRTKREDPNAAKEGIEEFDRMNPHLPRTV